MKEKFDEFVISVADVVDDFFYYKKNDSKFVIKKNRNHIKGVLGEKIKERIYALKKENSNKQYGEYIKYFSDVLQYNFPKEVLKNFYINIETVIIYGVNFQLGSFVEHPLFAGKYDSESNSISIDLKSDKSLSSIYHELFHMASTNNRHQNYLASGFHMKKIGSNKIGTSLNEGYTELMTMRYFYNPEYEIGYPLEYQYARALEIIVGKEKMEELYLTANGKGLTEELMKYESLDNIISFIREIDLLNEEDKRQVEHQRLINITSFLLNLYINKNIGNLNDSDDLNKFASLLPSTILLNNSAHYIDVYAITQSLINEKKYNGMIR